LDRGHDERAELLASMDGLVSAARQSVVATATGALVGAYFGFLLYNRAPQATTWATPAASSSATSSPL